MDGRSNSELSGLATARTCLDRGIYCIGPSDNLSTSLVQGEVSRDTAISDSESFEVEWRDVQGSAARLDRQAGRFKSHGRSGAVVETIALTAGQEVYSPSNRSRNLASTDSSAGFGIRSSRFSRSALFTVTT